MGLQSSMAEDTPTGCARCRSRAGGGGRRASLRSASLRTFSSSRRTSPTGGTLEKRTLAPALRAAPGDTLDPSTGTGTMVGTSASSRTLLWCPRTSSWRWDAATGPQVWVSCSSIEIVDEIIGSQIKCNGADNCCTAERPCGRNEGDCDSDSDCVGDLMCGANNCLDIAENQGKGFDSNDDCCYSPIIG